MTIFWIIYTLIIAAISSAISIWNASNNSWTVAISFSVVTILASIACGLHVGDLVRDRLFKKES